VSRPEGRTCAVCGLVSATTTEHSVHATLAHPELNRRASAQRRASGASSAAARAVSCWRCAALIPASTRTCGTCGWEHPGFEQAVAADTASRGEHERVALLGSTGYAGPELDQRGRPR